MESQLILVHLPKPMLRILWEMTVKLLDGGMMEVRDFYLAEIPQTQAVEHVTTQS